MENPQVKIKQIVLPDFKAIEAEIAKTLPKNAEFAAITKFVSAMAACLPDIVKNQRAIAEAINSTSWHGVPTSEEQLRVKSVSGSGGLD